MNTIDILKRVSEDPAFAKSLSDKVIAAASIPSLGNTSAPQWKALLDTVAETPAERQKIENMLNMPLNSPERLGHLVDTATKISEEGCAQTTTTTTTTVTGTSLTTLLSTIECSKHTLDLLTMTLEA